VSAAGPTEIVAADIGGTNARFAIATIAAGRVTALGDCVTLATDAHASVQTAWEAFAARVGRPLPRAAAVAIAAPVEGEVIRFTNSPWVIRPALIPDRLGVDRFVLVNDFEAVAHAVAQAADSDFAHLCGPDVALPATGVITVIGPGTGLGVAILDRHAAGYRVLPTEGGHVDFAPTDAIEDVILARLRQRYARVSVERVVSGPGIVEIHAALAALEGRPPPDLDDRAIWAAALSGADSLANAALDRFAQALGGVAGDMALAHGASAVVVAGGLGLRLRHMLSTSGFAQRFAAKGRYAARMGRLPVRLITHPQPGLLGAAAAFAQDAAREGL
jgi:glucokinase